MDRLTQKQALLLTVSGEVSPAARRAIMAQVMQDPALNSEYQEMREGMELLSALPIPEPSAAERREIPAFIKQTLRQALQEKEAASRFLLRRYAAGALAIAASVALMVGVWVSERSRDAAVAGHIAALNATVLRLGSVTMPAEKQLAVKDIAGPAVSDLPSLANLREVDSFDPVYLSAREFEDEPASDPSGPPGSY